MTTSGSGQPPRAPVYQGEVLSPLSGQISSAPDVSRLPQGAFGMAFFARARYASESKQIQAYETLVRAKSRLVEALTEQGRLLEGYALQAVRAQELDTLREIERLKIRAQRADLETATRIAQLRGQIEIEQLEQHLANLRKPSAASAPREKPGLADQFVDLGKEIDEIDRAHARLRADLVARAGGEAKLSDDDRHRLSKFDLLREQLLNQAMEALV